MNRAYYCHRASWTDNPGALTHDAERLTMSFFESCCTTFASLSRAAAKKTASQLRRIGVLPTDNNWQTRAEICERCPMRVIRNKISYCGLPYVEKPIRDFVAEGCGCPTIAKAKSPQDHCPMDRRMQPAVKTGDKCTCKWCTGT